MIELDRHLWPIAKKKKKNTVPWLSTVAHVVSGIFYSVVAMTPTQLVHNISGGGCFTMKGTLRLKAGTGEGGMHYHAWS